MGRDFRTEVFSDTLAQTTLQLPPTTAALALLTFQNKTSGRALNARNEMARESYR